MQKPDHEKITEIFSDPPRNQWEEREQLFLREMYTYVFKDPRSIDVFCKLIFAYREEITRMKMLMRAFGEDPKCEECPGRQLRKDHEHSAGSGI